MLQVDAEARPSIDSILESVELQLLSLTTPTPPATQNKAARSSERPDSLILNVSLDDVVARYPSLQELDQAEQVPRQSVKAMVQQLDTASPPRAVSIPMEKSTSTSMHDKPAPVSYTHLTLPTICSV